MAARRPTVLAVLVATGLAASATAQTAALDAAEARARTLPRLHSVLVEWRGDLILEQYARGWSRTRPANVKSASKSVVAALVGIAVERGLIKSLDQPIADYFPELRQADDPRKQQITVGHLLTMQSGQESTSFAGYGAWVTNRNWVRYVLALPMTADPGTAMDYSTGSSHLLSAILTKATGKSTWAFAREALGTPLDIEIARWQRDPQGIYFGGNNMLLTPRQMLAFGRLYLNDGRSGGTQVLPPGWVTASCTGRGRSRFNPDQQYGYGWWIRDFGGREACFAWGYGGQYIFVFDDLDLVVVTTSSVEPDDRRGHRRQIFEMVEADILPAIERAAGTAGAAPPPDARR